MVEVEGLKVVIAAEIRDAIENIRKVSTVFSNFATQVKKHAPNLDAFLTKWKLGWVTVGVAAIASLYALAKSSAYMSLWFAEASGAVGYFLNSALEPLSPEIEKANSGLWSFAETFDKLPAPIRGAVGAIILAVGGLTASLAGLKIVDILLGTTLATRLAIAVKTLFGGIGTLILGVITTRLAAVRGLITIAFLEAFVGIAWGLAIGIAAVFTLDKLGILNALDKVGRELEAKLGTVWDLVKILAAPLAALGSVIINIIKGNFDQILPDLKRIFWDETFLKVWNFVKEQSILALAAIPVVGPALAAMKIGQKIMGEQTGKTYIPEHEFWSRLSEAQKEAQEVTGHQMGTSFVPETGLYTLHRGEAVVPRGKSVSTGSTINFSPTINILNPQIKSDMDIRQLANQLTSYWRDDMQRFVRGVVA